MNIKYDVVIVASGKGERSKLGYNKTFFVMKDNDRVIDKSIKLFLSDEDCQKIIIVTNEEINFDDNRIVVTKGGTYRKDSVKNGLDLVTSEYVMVHDGARPFLRKENIDDIKDALLTSDAVCLGHMASDTVKLVSDNKIVKTIDRNNVFLAETPQAFKSELLKKAYMDCEDIVFSDDASLVESLGYEVNIVLNKYSNNKLTNEKDFIDL